jgi:hypothetical protein
MNRYPVHRFLDTNGDGTGTKNAIGDYSTPDEFFFTPAGADVFQAERLLVTVEDTNGMKSNLYGVLAALTNGIEVKIIDSDGSTVIEDLTDGLPIKTNAHWRRYCYDADVDAWGGAAPADDHLSVRWTLAKAGVPLILKAGQRISVFLNDNLTGLISHLFGLQGHYLNRGM